MKRTPRDLEVGEHIPGQVTIYGERLRLLSLFSGYGGLDMAVAALLDGDVIAHAEYEPPTKSNPNPSQAAARLLAYRFPGVPNLGDVSAVDWSEVAATLGPVDVITGGFPCQDISLAGRRLGIRHDTRSGLWGHMAAAVDGLRPGLVVIENVRGILSARAHHPAHSDMEPCPWCLARPDDVHLRALGAVLGDLSDLGYHAAWRTIRAADVGAPHGRERVFVVAWPTTDTADDDGDRRPGARAPGRWPGVVGAAGDAADVVGQRGRTVRDEHPGRPREARGAGRPAAEDTECEPCDERWLAAPGQTEGRRARADAGGRGRAPAADAARPGPQGHGTVGREPALAEHGGDHAPAAHPDGDGREGLARSQAGRNAIRAVVGGDADGCSGGAAAADPEGDGRDEGWAESAGELGGPDAAFGGAQADRWGSYGPAVARWEAVLGRPAPDPTEASARGAQRLSPRFVEWMMGLPAGWVVDVPGVTRNEALKLLGNGVVPQQAAAAVASLLDVAADATAPPAPDAEGGAA